MFYSVIQRSIATKDLVHIYVDVSETLRSALSDKMLSGNYWLFCIIKSKNEGR